jgi:tRNA A37 threonylcarbamoyladenosine modification protein TsaB
MYLLLDLSTKDSIKLSLFNKQTKLDKAFLGMNRELLFSIDKFLKQQKIKKTEVEGIMVVVGEGSFTSTRLAVTVANTFAYILQIPLLAINKDQADKAQTLIPELLKQPKGQYLSATYSGEPNIGKFNK